MKGRLARIAVVFVSALTCACSTTYRLSIDTLHQSSSWSRLEHQGSTRSSYVLADNRWTRAESLAVGDSSLLLLLGGNRSVAIPWSKVEQVVFRKPGDGAAKGVLIGLSIAVLSGISTATSFEGPGDGGSAFSWGVAIGGMTALVTIPVGAVLGAIIGSPDRFRFESTTSDQRQHP